LAELEDMRLSAEKKGQVFRFKSPWRNKFQSQNTAVKPVIRIKAPLEGFCVINDLVQGNISVNNQELDDLVLLRSDNTPTYMLAVVVDDHDMEISHIIRGDDHLTNAFRQQIIYQAMNWQVPKFAHIPLIHGSDGAKMSKRHGATSVIEYKKMGYLPEALRNYLLRLGWSHGNDEIINDENAIKYFNIENIGKSPSRFDFAKLNFLNKHYIKNYPDDKLLELVNDYLNKKISLDSKKFLKILSFSKEKIDTIVDLAKICEIYQDDFYCNINANDAEILQNKIVILKKIYEMLQEIPEFNTDSLKQNFENFNIANNLKIKDYGLALRISLTYSSASAGGIFDVLELLDKKEALKRIKLVI
jgi:glutamyl-tRNA synthetase